MPALTRTMQMDDLVRHDALRFCRAPDGSTRRGDPIVTCGTRERPPYCREHELRPV
jgi:hypothetical protein